MIDSAVRALFKDGGELRSRVRNALGHLSVLNEHHEVAPSEDIWKEYHDLMSTVDDRKVNTMTESELVQFCGRLVQVALSWEREDAVYDYRKSKGEPVDE
jgi:hypothetical protein